MRYAAYISGLGTRIKKALELIDGLADKVKLIVSDDSESFKMKKFLEEKDISYYLINYEKIEGNKEEKNLYLSNRIYELFETYQIDYCFSFGKHLLKGKLLECYQYKIINFHAGLLPMYPGINALDKMKKGTERYVGNTVNFIDEGIDTGPIIMQNVMLVENFDLYGYDAVLDEQITLLKKLDMLLFENRIHVVDGKCIVDGADYRISNIYPDV